MKAAGGVAAAFGDGTHPVNKESAVSSPPRACYHRSVVMSNEDVLYGRTATDGDGQRVA